MPRHSITCWCRRGFTCNGCECCCLAVCLTCGAYEGSLTTDCPGVKIDFARQQEINQTPLDFTDARGWHQRDPAQPRAPRFEDATLVTLPSELLGQPTGVAKADLDLVVTELSKIVGTAAVDSSVVNTHVPRWTGDVPNSDVLTRVVGCSCGWQCPSNEPNSDTAFTLHAASAYFGSTNAANKPRGYRPLNVARGAKADELTGESRWHLARPSSEGGVIFVVDGPLGASARTFMASGEDDAQRLVVLLERSDRIKDQMDDVGYYDRGPGGLFSAPAAPVVRMDLKDDLAQKAIAWAMADRDANQHSAELESAKKEADAYLGPRKRLFDCGHVAPAVGGGDWCKTCGASRKIIGLHPTFRSEDAPLDARAQELLGKLERVKIDFHLADQHAQKCDDEFRQAARKLVEALERGHLSVVKEP
jgi:hypothetical protein